MRKIPNLHESHFLTYALDSPSSGGKLVNIDEVENGNACNCFCPACHEPLIAKNNGDIREHHFAHKSGTECEHAYESMLHLYAKEAIQQEFLSAKKFDITFEQKSYCSKIDDCVLSPMHKDCYRTFIYQYNIKTYYDSCEQEVAYSNQTGRSDLKIYSSTDPDRKPIYIEFYVTHASCLKKLHSGNKIIEAKIESLNDIFLIKKLGFIEQNATTNDYDESYPIVNFYGFNRQNKENTTVEQAVLRVRFSLYETGKTFFETCWATCKDTPERKYETSILEIMFYETSIHSIEHFAMYFGYNKYKIKNCALCTNYVDSYNIRQGKICRFHKHLKLNKPQPDTSTAKTCQYFHIDEERMNKDLANGPDASYEIVYER